MTGTQYAAFQSLLTPDNLKSAINYVADSIGGLIWTVGVFAIICIILNYVGKMMVIDWEKTYKKPNKKRQKTRLDSGD